MPALLLSTAFAAHAQQAAKATAPPQATNTPTPEQQAQLAKQNQQMAQAATQVAQQIDQNKAGDIWDGASTIAKTVATRDAFIKQTAADRKTLGTVKTRTVVAVTRSQSNGQKIPAGVYINVVFATEFSNATQPVRELISFHLDGDNTWRLAGYTLH
ncbi:DUF4019 domain-containing protein [Dyella tabacisoli]|uniref:DUF4019 domain-containing protein n=1 Tax=Dyella tabacisoli TaxID=2282381 RepID=A0A369UH75_9GAMM|nr:DUF4019 domain-containing protein [Dyella tabacisoli]